MLSHEDDALCDRQLTSIGEPRMLFKSLSFLLLLFLTPLVTSKDDLRKETAGMSGEKKLKRREAFSLS